MKENGITKEANPWVTFCKRTLDPKLRYIECRLDERNIKHRRNGQSFHGSILEVPAHNLEEAMSLLDARVKITTTLTLDDVPDDHPMFTQKASP